MIYEDRLVTVDFAPNAAATGHILVTPRKKVQALAELSPEESAHLFLVASYTAAILFQGIQAEGTNIITQEGKQLIVHVIARKQDDGIDFQWTPLNIDEGSMGDAEEKIKDKAFYVGKSQVTETGESPDEQPPNNPEDGENYLIKHLIKNV